MTSDTTRTSTRLYRIDSWRGPGTPEGKRDQTWATNPATRKATSPFPRRTASKTEGQDVQVMTEVGIPYPPSHESPRRTVRDRGPGQHAREHGRYAHEIQIRSGRMLPTKHARPSLSCLNPFSWTTVRGCMYTRASAGRQNLFYDPSGYGGISETCRPLYRGTSATTRRRSWPLRHRRRTPTGAGAGYEAANQPGLLSEKPECLRPNSHVLQSEKAKRIEFRCPDCSCNPTWLSRRCSWRALTGLKRRWSPTPDRP